MWLRRYLPQLPYFNRLILSPSPNTSVAHSHISPENVWPGVGTRGTAVTDLRPGGSAQFVDLSVGDKRTIAVVSESGYLPRDQSWWSLSRAATGVVVRPAAD